MKDNYVIFRFPDNLAGQSGQIIGRSDLMPDAYLIRITSGPLAGQEHHFKPMEFHRGGSDPVPSDSQ